MLRSVEYEVEAFLKLEYQSSDFFELQLIVFIWFVHIYFVIVSSCFYNNKVRLQMKVSQRWQRTNAWRSIASLVLPTKSINNLLSIIITFTIQYFPWKHSAFPSCIQVPHSTKSSSNNPMYKCKIIAYLLCTVLLSFHKYVAWLYSKQHLVCKYTVVSNH